MLRGTTSEAPATLQDSCVGTAEKLRFLRDPQSYPDEPSIVEVIETHYSWVFLTAHYAYKLKKPVRDHNFDFRSAAARRRNACSEVRLNRRFAGDVYLGVVPLTARADGRLALDGAGKPVDWLVMMRRLAAARTFDRRLTGGTWRYSDLEPIAWCLAACFASARQAPITPPQFLARLNSELKAAGSALATAREPRLRSAAQPVVRALRAFLVRRADLFRRRVRARRIVDGHGDLRPEHIYVDGRPRIIDCLEFHSDLRRGDPVSELAYLDLECRRLGGPPIAARLLRRYRERTGDAPPDALVRFYAALNALIRARIAVQHIAEPGARPREEWLCRAGAYVAIAAGASRRLRRRHG